MTAEERAGELFCDTRVCDIPDKAKEYNRFLCQKYGGCGEVTVTAYAHYAQAIEKLKSKDSSYKIDKEGKKWFKENT